mgnify:CR=1 FL=1|jgi:hypothetical protein
MITSVQKLLYPGQRSDAAPPVDKNNSLSFAFADKQLNLAARSGQSPPRNDLWSARKNSNDR